MISSNFPPGLLYIVQSIPSLALSLLPVLIAHRFLPYHLPIYVWTLAYILAVPIIAVVKGVLQYVREEREIKGFGARRVPQVHTRWPGGVDALLFTVKSFSEGSVADAWEEFSHNYGSTFNVRILWDDLFVTTEPDNLKSMLATDFDNFEKGWKFQWHMESVLGTGVFNSDGDMWKFHRGMARPFFARDRVTDFELFDRHAEAVVAQLRGRFSQGEAIDFQDLMSRFTLDSATQFMFGSCLHSLSANLPYAENSPRRNILYKSHRSDKFAAAFTDAQQQIALRTQYSDAWPLAEFWKDKTKESMKVIYDCVDPMIRDALAKKGDVEKEVPIVVGGEDGTLLDHLIGQTDDHVILRDEILNIMIAGRDTTTATLTFVVYCLSQYPNVLARLREEILTKVGPNRRPTFDDVKECRYMRAVINETLRLFPPVPINVRSCKNSTTWTAPDGGKPYYVPAGVEIAYSVWLMHRRTDLWGPDALEFDPDRFLDERLHKYMTPNPFVFLPFNAGPRICLGQQFAYNETSFMLIRLLQAFDTINLAPDAQPLDSHPSASWQCGSGRQRQEKIWPKAHLTLYSYKGLWLRMGEVQHTDIVREPIGRSSR